MFICFCLCVFFCLCLCVSFCLFLPISICVNLFLFKASLFFLFLDYLLTVGVYSFSVYADMYLLFSIT